MSEPRTAVRPGSLRRALLGQVLLLLLGLLAAGLVVVLHDQLVRSWAEGNAAAREYLRYLTLAEFEAQRPIDIPAFTDVTLVLWVVMASLLAVLARFLWLGHGWARPVVTAYLVIALIGTGGVLRVGAPGVFQVIAVVALLLLAAVLVELWRPETGAFFAAVRSGRDLEDEPVVALPRTPR